MISTSIRRAIAPSIAGLAVVATLAACGADNEDSADPAASAAPSGLSGKLNAGGASSQEKAQAAWVASMQEANDGLTIDYAPVGSGDGRAGFISGEFAFAGTDSALDDDEGELTAATETCGASPIQVPAYVSPIAIAYNLPGVDSLNLSADVVSDIFSGKITNWSDPAIADGNEGVPDLAITPVHRSDDSGTQENFTKYLEEAGSWSYEADGVWPSDIKGGEGAEGTSGVASVVGATEGAVGFMDNSAALESDFTVVSVAVGAEFVPPSSEAAAKILEVSEPAGLTDTDMAVSLARDTEESGVYPVVLVSYLLACQSYDDADQAELVKAYLEFVLSSEGQQLAAEEAGSAPLPSSIEEQALTLVGTIS
ncbi:phosphate ABC transporter substrate-binding protein PstS [soil metagenome]